MGTYTTPSKHRRAYDDDGTIFRVSGHAGSGVQSGTIVNDQNTATKYNLGRSWDTESEFRFAFPEPIDLTGYLVITGFFNTGFPGTLEWFTSTNTTDGTDGTWTSRGAPTRHIDGTTTHMRNSITAVNYPGITGVRFDMKNQSNAFDADGPREIHLYGTPSAATGPRLDFWDPTANQRLGPAALDFDDIPRCQWQPRPFRIHNSSPDTEATGITVGRNALNPGSPSILESLLFSTDQITWSTSVTIDDLPAGATSPKIWVVSAVPSNGPTGLRWARAYVDCNEFDRSHHYAYWYVVDTATPEPGRLIRVTPNVGSEGETVEIMGIGLGTTQGRWSAIPRINDIAMTVTSWTNVAETSGASDGFLDETADDTNLEHQLIEVTVPPGAETGVITVDVDDGT